MTVNLQTPQGPIQNSGHNRGRANTFQKKQFLILLWIFYSQYNYTKFCHRWEYFIAQQLKRGSIHSANHTKQLPNVPLSETLGHAKILLTLHWDVIRLMLQWFRVIKWNYTRTCSGSLLSDNQMHLSKPLVVWEQNFCAKKYFSHLWRNVHLQMTHCALI